MRLMRFIDSEGRPHYGAGINATEAFPVVGDPFGEFRVSPQAVRIVRRLAPVEAPNVIAIGRNYREHAREMSAGEEAEPLIFLKATTSVIGPDDAIILPRSAPEEVDYEGELAVVIGRRAKDVPEDEALGYVLGFTCANDVSARDCQKRRDRQWARGKSFDTFCPLGPQVVPVGELDPGALTIRTTLNGQVMQEGSTSDMIFPVRQLVSYLSHQFTLLPGTVILTGTPSGVGAARTPPVFLRPGDEIEVEIGGIGRLKNTVRSAD